MSWRCNTTPVALFTSNLATSLDFSSSSTFPALNAAITPRMSARGKKRKMEKTTVCGPVVKINMALLLLNGRGEVFQLIIFVTKSCITHRATFSTTVAGEKTHSL